MATSPPPITSAMPRMTDSVGARDHTAQSISAAKDNDCVNERAELGRRGVTVGKHDEHLVEKLRKADAKQVNPGPRLKRLPVDRGDRRGHHGGQQEVI